ncbi:MAG: hypothetical protein GX259_00795 [Bacteroidales bacterium]|jgi:hypothetical protein|nr:hypothetical protein [Bacteroidales bacterium]
MSAELTKSTKQIYTGVLIIALSSVLLAITSFILFVISAVVINKGDMSMSASFSFMAILGLIVVVFGILSFVGYIIYFLGINKFKTLVNNNDKPAAKILFLGVLLSLIGALLAIIPVIGVVGGFVSLAGSILMIVAYNKLKNSSTMPEKAKKGWSLLFISALALVLVFVIGFIPVAGLWLSSIVSIFAWIMIIIGWKKIKTHLV